MNNEDLAILDLLDDGTLYADPLLIQDMFSYPHLADAYLLVSRDPMGNPTGYIPVGVSDDETIISYIAAIPPSAPVCPTYTPGAENVLQELPRIVNGSYIYFDVDVVSEVAGARQEETASAMCLPLEEYLTYLSPSRRKDIKRKLKKSSQFEIESGGLKDVWQAWPWMQATWELRQQYDSEHVSRVLSWLAAIDKSGRAVLKVDKYSLNGQMVGVNCCVLHDFHGVRHCDDYLTWYDVEKASGLGIISSVKNLTDARNKGVRYNLGLPGFYGQTFEGHEYKWDLIPKGIRLTQSIVNIQIGGAEGEIDIDSV